MTRIPISRPMFLSDMKPVISIIVAVAENNAIGYQGDLVYHISADLKRFKALTTGHTVMMGRRTFMSLPKGALPNRRNIVLSRNSSFEFPGAERFGSIGEALEHCSENEHVYVIGGAEVYRQALPMADELQLTQIHALPAAADTYFPEIDMNEWVETERVDCLPDDKNSYSYSFVTLRRR